MSCEFCDFIKNTGYYCFDDLYDLIACVREHNDEKYVVLTTTTHDIITEHKINYCPLCSKKLSELLEEKEWKFL